ncbi:hypothetical protein [Oceanospirillum maris]|uniref:hypothetical protein n=1 Tax=Oceanospirillum maris TaxID=64977 RepID=UPI0012FF533E|nr:hypothetical protein [Oceanospirillum maris]
MGKKSVYELYEEINSCYQELKEWAEQPVNAEQIEFVEREQMHEALELYPAKIMGLGGALVEMEQRVKQWKQQNTSSAKH